MSAGDLSEFAVRPRLMLVHQPLAFAGLDAFTGAADTDVPAVPLFRERPDAGRLIEQHLGLVTALQAHVSVASLADVLGPSGVRRHRETLASCINLLFAHDAMITLPWLPDAYIPAAMREPVRRRETYVYADIAAALGLRPLLSVPERLYLEGGDVFPIAHDGVRRLLVGHGPRTSSETPRYLRDTLVADGIVDEIVAIELAPWRLNLDGCCFPVARTTVVVNPASLVAARRYFRDGELDVDPLTCLAALGFTALEASRDESFLLQACNFACVGAGKLIAYGMTERINHQLRQRGLDVTAVAGTELVKGNGGPHCLTRPIY